VCNQGSNSGKVIDPKMPIQAGKGGNNTDRLRIDGATSNLGSPTITPLGGGRVGMQGRTSKMKAMRNGI
jgi:hypothetical protein